MTNGEIAELLRAVAASYQIENESKNRFRIIAYNRAADAVEHLGTEAKDIFDEEGLGNIPGIGKSISEHLGDIFKTGKSAHFEKILKGIPKAALTLMSLQSIGPKKAYRLAVELNLPDKNTLGTLKTHAENGDIAKMDGFGEVTQKEIIAAIGEFIERPPRRLLLSEAEDYAESIINWLKNGPKIERIDALGSLRRKAPTVGDIDLSVATDNGMQILEHFSNFPYKTRILNKGERSASILLPGNVRADLKVEPAQSYGALLQHFTGSKHHNVALREYALKKDMSLSEHGIKIHGRLKKVKSEEEFYKLLGLDFIPPELREGTDEIERAISGKLPNLIELGDVKADLQMHSNYDIETSHDIGASSMEEMLICAKKLGYQYVAFTEHNPSQKGHSKTQICEILKRKKEHLDRVNANKIGVHGFNSLEIDILPDGSLPVDRNGLRELDFALVSLHSSFKKPKNEMTKRVLSALSEPKVKIFAHPTARILEKREGVELDWPVIFDFCKKNNKWIEINADPHRLDLPDFLIREAVKIGVKLTLGTDSHHKEGLQNMRYGVAMARRGGAEKEDIINSLTLQEFLKVL